MTYLKQDGHIDWAKVKADTAKREKEGCPVDHSPKGIFAPYIQAFLEHDLCGVEPEAMRLKRNKVAEND